MNVFNKNLVTRWWWLSSVFSLGCIVVIAMIWYQVDIHYQPNKHQLLSEDAAKAHLVEEFNQTSLSNEQNLQYIPTGIYLQSFKFSSSNDVRITGYIWQRYLTAKLETTEPKANFIFPEQVGGSSDFELAYQHQVGEHTVLGWYFDVTLRQKFSYKNYPLDHKTVWIKLWPAHFDRNIVLLPALNDYHSTAPGDTFGIDTDIVIGNWEINETFFDYKLGHYDTSFGFNQAYNEQNYPELSFNLVLKRKFLNAFVIHLVPLLTVAVLLFASLMSVTAEQVKRETFGFNFTAIISIVSALFFVVMLSHIQLRKQFAEDGIVYIEYFFLLMYFIMISIICNTYFFSRGKEYSSGWLHAQDHLIPKLIYWPLTLGSMALVTYCHFVG
ncbi:hypothetical protein tinsulaeT_21750 [Thalassotalea insulae]|uniref:Uncharacterized protein n=1 Tax=Thalassotalea insulae TaxID=2056778 RepID=A0ABQ6GWE7_9GAMM|nr:hypothetical protein [Thalassotalea insulae]GLX78835.1 hypothetical protein tinsulaeT_21750 [Thalassotalea insulae]